MRINSKNVITFLLGLSCFTSISGRSNRVWKEAMFSPKGYYLLSRYFCPFELVDYLWKDGMRACCCPQVLWACLHRRTSVLVGWEGLFALALMYLVLITVQVCSRVSSVGYPRFLGQSGGIIHMAILSHCWCLIKANTWVPYCSAVSLRSSETCLLPNWGTTVSPIEMGGSTWFLLISCILECCPDLCEFLLSLRIPCGWIW